MKKRCTEINIIRTFFDLIGTMVHVFIYYIMELSSTTFILFFYFMTGLLCLMS